VKPPTPEEIAIQDGHALDHTLLYCLLCGKTLRDCSEPYPRVWLDDRPLCDQRLLGLHL
jgi:hypothetical protein